MPYQLQPETQAFLGNKLKERGFTSQQIAIILEMMASVSGQFIERFIASVRVDPSEVKNLKMDHVPKDKQATFVAGGEYAIGFYNMVLNKYLKEQGMNPQA